MTTSLSSPRRLYLMQVATMTVGPLILPVTCYLVQMTDGTNVLIDTGLVRERPARSGVSATTVQHDSLGRPLLITHGADVLTQLAAIDVRPADIDLLICSHFDDDHAGALGVFSHACLIAQRQQYDVARAGHPRFARTRSQWDQPAARYWLVDGDTPVLPGLELIETSGHVPGHQAVLVDLLQTGPVLLAIDAVALQAHFTPDRPIGPTDADEAGTRASTRKLLELAEKRRVALVVFGHDELQWSALKRLPDFYA